MFDDHKNITILDSVYHLIKLSQPIPAQKIQIWISSLDSVIHQLERLTGQKTRLPHHAVYGQFDLTNSCDLRKDIQTPQKQYFYFPKHTIL